MSEQQSNDDKMDAQTTLLKWILAGVGSGLLGIAVFVGGFINNAMSRRDDGEKFLREQIVQALTNQTAILKEIRDDQKKFPAVAAPTK